MKVAIPIWQGKVSSVFDFADELLLIELENGIEKSRNEVSLTEQSGPERTARLRSAEQFLGLWLTCSMALGLRYYRS